MAKLALVFTCIGIAAFDGYTQINYGDPDKQATFDIIKSVFPGSFTMNDNVRAIYSLELKLKI
jgi:hypothetical protein